jgi:DNA repair exonuclease SbcCD ATPase subunit
MIGSRNFYTKRAYILHNKMSFPEDPDDIDNIYAAFKSEYENFIKATSRSYRILQQFFEHEANAIVKDIKQIENTLKKIKDQAADLKYLNDVKNLTKEILNKIDAKTRLGSAQKKNIKMSIQLKEEITAERAKLAELESSEQQKNLDELNSKTEELNRKIKGHEQTMIHNFAVLESSLKKFIRITYDCKEIVAKYLKDPVQALLKDSNLKIIYALHKLRSAIDKKEIELKDKKESKTLSMINILTKQYLQDFTTKHNSITENLIELKDKKSELTIEKEIIQQRDKLAKLDKKLDSINRESDRIRNDLQNIGVSDSINNLNKMLEKFRITVDAS